MARKVKTKAKIKTGANKRRKGALALVLPWLRRFGGVLGAIVFCLWIGAWLWLSGAVHSAASWVGDKAVNASADLGFRVENILVEGRENADPEIILAVINMQKDDPLFAFDPKSAREQLEKISWVRSAHVERRLPDTLYIRIEERLPLALYQHGGKLKLLDMRGEVIETDRIDDFKSLMVLEGKGAPENVIELAAGLMSEDVLNQRIKKAVWVGARRWDLYFAGGIVAKLPEDDVLVSLGRLGAAHEENNLLDKDIVSIDLREEDRIAVRTKPGLVEEYRSTLKKSAAAGNNI